MADELDEAALDELEYRASAVERFATEMRGLRKEIDKARDESDMEWKAFDAAQKALPPEARMKYDTWLACDWGQRISVLEAGYSALAANWSGAVSKARGQRS